MSPVWRDWFLGIGNGGFMNSRARQWFNSITAQFVMAAVLSFCLLIAGVLYDGNRTLNTAVLQNVHASVKQTSQLLNLTVSAYLSAGDLQTVGVFFREMLDERSENGLVYVIVIGDDGHALLNTMGAGKAIPEPGDMTQLDTSNLKTGVLHIRNPLLLPGRKVGALQYGLSVKNLFEATVNEQNNSLIRICLIMLATFVAIMLLGLRISGRLHEMIRASQEIVSGQYTQSIRVSGRDELATLAAHFNTMAHEVTRKIQEITELNQTLEHKVSQRTEELELSNRLLEQNIAHLKTAHDQLVQAEKLAALGAIVAAVAHELNTPIGNCLTVASTLQYDTAQFEKQLEVDGLRRNQLSDYLAAVGEGTALLLRGLERAVKLVTNFKQVAVDQTGENRRTFDLKEVIDGVVALMTSSLRSKPYQLELDIPPALIMDSYPGPIEQIVANLINNAVLHGFEGRDHGTMRLSATPEEDAVRLIFSDDGVGMSDEVLHHIFDPFFTTRLGRGGSGLGMSITYNLVTGLLGGRVEVSSQLGQGSTFTLVLPRVAPVRDVPKA